MLAVAGYLLWVEPLIAAFAALVYLPQALVVPRVQEAINRLTRRRTWLVRRHGRSTVAIDGNVAERDASLRRRAHALADAILATRMRIYARKYFVTFFSNVLDALGPIAVLVVGGWLVIEGRTEISTLVVFISGFQRLTDPWDQLLTYYRTAWNARVAYGLMAEALGGRAPRSR
jgi:ABC-type bacteriocin/lantibiotic exporter with double-glycine peptidase domain